MSFKAIQLTEPLAEYFSSVAVREPDILVQLREETQGMEKAIMQITPEQGAFLTQLTGARRTIKRKVHGDTRVSVCMLTIGDGLTLARQLG